MLKELLAKEFILFYEGRAVGFSTDYSLNVTADQIDVSVNRDAWYKFREGRKGYTLSASGIVSRGTDESKTSFRNILNDLKTKEKIVDIALKSIHTGDEYEYGKCLVKNVNITGSVGSRLMFSMELQGTGELSTATATLLHSLQTTNITSTTALLSWEIN